MQFQVETMYILLYTFLHNQNPSCYQLKEYPSDFQSQNIRSEDRDFDYRYFIYRFWKKASNWWNKSQLVAKIWTIDKSISQGGHCCFLIISYSQLHPTFFVISLRDIMILHISIILSLLQQNYCLINICRMIKWIRKWIYIYIYAYIYI